ncbi:uncharacterized protein LOC142898061 [Nelusetta ayraudi]|uniref:uncharacterized protein LOC142898061 n=1 Tax=Nelusetta ayraudi TaxID=303726 RepID=UPI003F6F6DEB
MPLKFNGQSEELEGDGWSPLAPARRSPAGSCRSRSSVCWIGAVALCLGLLLLSVILVAHTTNKVNQWDAKYTDLMEQLWKGQDGQPAEQNMLRAPPSNLTRELKVMQNQHNTLAASLDRLQEELNRLNVNRTDLIQLDARCSNMIYELSKSKKNLTAEQEQLKTQFNNLTGEMEALQKQYDSVVASRDQLQEEFDRLNPKSNVTERMCPSSWIKFGNKCYFVSPSSQKKNYANSRKDCQSRGGDLVKITSRLELDFVKTHRAIAWIGLTRAEDGHSWVWVDGTTLENHEFWQDGEPNNADMEEDCVEISREASAWNDVPCSRSFSWVCES